MFFNQSLLGFLRLLVGTFTLFVWPFFIGLIFGLVDIVLNAKGSL